MKHNTEYDMSFEAIQAAIMENMPKNLIHIEDKTYSARGDSGVPITPYVRPAPEKLFQLSEEDQLEFEKLRKALSSQPDEADPNVERKFNKADRRANQALFNSTRPQPAWSFSAKTQRDEMFSKYMPAETVLLKRNDKQMNELDEFLEKYHVPEAQMESIFNLTDEELQKTVPQHEQEVINFLQKTSERYKRIRVETQSSVEHVQSPEQPEVIVGSERKTTYCDLRNAAVSGSSNKLTSLKTNGYFQSDRNEATSSSDSASEQDDGLWLERYRNYRQRQKRITLKDPKILTKSSGLREIGVTAKTEDICDVTDTAQKDASDTLVERRRAYCTDILRSNGLEGNTNLLLHEEVSFTPGIPLVPVNLLQDATTTRQVHLKLQCQKLGIHCDQDDSDRQSKDCFKTAELERQTNTLFAIFSWLISLVPSELDQRETSSVNLKTVGLLRMANPVKQNHSTGIALLDEVQLHVLLSVNIMQSDGQFTTDDDVEKCVNQTCWDMIRNWSMDEIPIHTSTLHQLNELEFLAEEDTALFSLHSGKHTFWGQTTDADLPSCLQGVLSSSGESRWILERTTENCPNSEHSLLDEFHCRETDDNLDDHEFSEVLIEVNLNQLPVKKVQSIIFALLFNLYHVGLDLIGLRLGWIDRSSPNSSTQSGKAEQPTLALSFRGLKAWAHGKTICTWMTSRLTCLEPETIRCFGSRCRSETIKHMTRWFGPRFPDVARMSPVKIARAKHQAAALLDYQQHPCWLIQSEPSDLILTLPVSQCAVLSTVIRLAVDHCGYQLFYLGISEWKPCQKEKEIDVKRITIQLPSFVVSQELLKENNDNSNSEYAIVLVLRRENCIARLGGLIKQLKEATNREQKSDMSRKPTNGSQFTINIIPYDDGIRKLFCMDKLLQLPNNSTSSSTCSTSDIGNLCPPTSDCPQLGLVMIRSCALNNGGTNPSYGHRPGRGRFSPPAAHIFHQILDRLVDANRAVSDDTELQILGIKWLPITCVSPQIREFVEKYFSDAGESSRCRRRECAIGIVLVLGRSVQSAMQTFEQTAHTVFVTGLETVGHIVAQFFHPNELLHLNLGKHWIDELSNARPIAEYDESLQASNVSERTKEFPMMWHTILQSIRRSWIPQQIVLTIPWFKNLAASDWLTDFITLIKKFTKDSFVLESCYTNCDGRTLCRFSRPNGISRIRQLTRTSSLMNERNTGPKTPAVHDSLTHVELNQMISSPIPGPDEMQDLVADFQRQLMNSDRKLYEWNDVGEKTFEIYDDILNEWSNHFKEVNLLAIRFNQWPNGDAETISSEQQSARGQCVRDLMDMCKLLQESYFIVAGFRYGFLDETQLTHISQVVDLYSLQAEQKTEPGQYALLAIVGTLGCEPVSRFLSMDRINKNNFSERIHVFVGDPTKVARSIFGLMGSFLMPYCRANPQ